MLKNILSGPQIQLTIERLAVEMMESRTSFQNTVIIGLQPRGIYFSDKIVDILTRETSEVIQYGQLDITFYRDDVHRELHIANKTNIHFSIENKEVILIDDVLFTGRTIRSAFDAILDFGRPSKVELCVLIDRRFSREFPIEATYCGKAINTFENDKVKVRWKTAGHPVDEVMLHP